MELIIATRKSKLAQVQADKVIELIKEKNNINAKKLLVVTEGDRRLDVTLDKIGGKGLFVKEIEYALLNKEAHAAVHSMKDVPFELSEDFELVAIPERDDIRDVFVSSNGIHFQDLKEGAIIGTSSIRRAAMLKELRRDLNVVPIRGNVQTRLDKMKKENMDGIILAAAGIKRLGLEDIITDCFDPKEFLPAIGQGALGIEALKNGEYNNYLKKLDNKEVRIAVEAERSFMKKLNGGCHSVIGVYSEIKNDDLYMIGTFDVGGKIIKKDILGKKSENIELGFKLAQKILEG
ncbi:MAG: hydroxymethylbilane synthase [Clostridium sp.]|uniref:hydroxymethylbilane synthase n=1 Tax=Clostridium sp. TaxID=1506 RepID=UPI001EB1BF93|nr:hydroxymethylbilane synthase [Clostridium sp.]MBS5885296.1 hydroxymethylbilane synthase [Clostridium sp.]MDU7149153.1 hydroxymethylbilane synthase [Clostridium sp.]MDU7242808.1 hydroxymethylbilane synthase [Clostridium sp.]